MAYEITWLVEKRLLLTTISGKFTQIDLQLWVYELDKQIKSTDLTVHHISDSRHMEKLDISIGGLRTFLRAFQRPSHFGWHIEVRPQPISHLVLSIVNQVLNMQIHMCDSLEEALKFLAEKDPALSPLIKNMANK